jgi:hypothetical protein
MLILLKSFLLASVLFVASMIDTRGKEQFGTCVVGEYAYTLVSNLDCDGKFYEL